MKKISPTRQERLNALEKQVKKLYAEIQKASVLPDDEPLKIHVQETHGRFKRVHNTEGPDFGIGEFFMLLNVTPLKQAVSIPVSIASGKKPTGFVYQIEGTKGGSIVTTDISCKGEGVTHITLGTILYAKIPQGMTGTFRILIEVRGAVGKEYSIVINRINYKYDATDARYEKYVGEIRSKVLKFL